MSKPASAVETVGSEARNSGPVVWHQALVTREQREAANGHKAAAVWFTGLPSAGKSTIAHEVERRLFVQGCRTFVLDGGNVRHGLCSDLGFSESGRRENIRRIGEVTRLFRDAGTIVLAAFISPLRASRSQVRALLSPERGRVIAAARAGPGRRLVEIGRHNPGGSPVKFEHALTSGNTRSILSSP